MNCRSVKAATRTRCMAYRQETANAVEHQNVAGKRFLPQLSRLLDQRSPEGVVAVAFGARNVEPLIELLPRKVVQAASVYTQTSCKGCMVALVSHERCAESAQASRTSGEGLLPFSCLSSSPVVADHVIDWLLQLAEFAEHICERRFPTVLWILSA